MLPETGTVDWKERTLAEEVRQEIVPDPDRREGTILPEMNTQTGKVHRTNE